MEQETRLESGKSDFDTVNALYSKYPEFRFCKIKYMQKNPYEKEWQKKPYTWEQIKAFVQSGGNFGVICGYGGLIVIDADEEELRTSVTDKLPKTLQIKTGRGGMHYYYICKEVKKKIILQTDKHYGEVQASEGVQVVGAGSIHPNGNKYEIINNIQIAEIGFADLTLAIKPFMTEVKEEEEKAEDNLKKWLNDKDLGDADINTINITSVMNLAGFKKASNGELFGTNPWHGSTTGMNTWINPSKNVGHCFRCNCGFNVAQAIALNEGIIKNCFDKLDKDQFKKVLEIAQERYGLKKIKQKQISKIKTEEAKKIISQPLFYDKSGIWWLWNENELKWEIVDEVDILNMVEEKTGADIISSKARTELLNFLKQRGRKNMPKPINKNWIQFKDTIIDLITGKEIKASPEYFVTNPIPWKLHNERYIETPTMDRIFTEWVGEKYVPLLYEILAYCLLPQYPLHRIFCFYGSGLNGKSSYLELMRKFVGEENCCSTELDNLILSRFEITRLYKKLVCQMGETDFNEINKTSMLKRLSGGDFIGFEFKNKTPFQDINYAKIIISTNNLPSTTDKTPGFYRRWIIVDFPNRFNEQKNILDDIPNEEYEILAVKACLILKDLLKNRSFTAEGTMEERMERYESRSNFLEKFIELFIEEDVNGNIIKSDFIKKFKAWCKENRHREMSDTSIGLAMKKLGYQSGIKGFNWMNDGKGGTARVWFGIKWKV